MNRKLVSIVAPCYNKENTCGRFIESIIKQTYRPIELIVINDGSTDNSEEIILSFVEKLENANVSFKYIAKANAGVGAAINDGLREVEGEYICWPDIDDWYEPDATEAKVIFLDAHPEYAVVTSNAYVHNENSMNSPAILVKDASSAKVSDENQFAHLLNGQSVVCPGCHMARTRDLFASLEGREIFPSRFGQNLQLLLPLFYNHKRFFLDKPLYHYVIYNESHSHFSPNYDRQMKEREGRYEIKLKTIESIRNMTDSDRNKYIEFIGDKEARYRLDIAFEHKNQALGRKQIEYLRRKRKAGFKEILEYWGTFNVIADRIYRLIR